MLKVYSSLLSLPTPVRDDISYSETLQHLQTWRGVYLLTVSSGTKIWTDYWVCRYKLWRNGSFCHSSNTCCLEQGRYLDVGNFQHINHTYCYAIQWSVRRRFLWREQTPPSGPTPYSPELQPPVHLHLILCSYSLRLYRKSLLIPFLLRSFISQSS